MNLINHKISDGINQHRAENLEAAKVCYLEIPDTQPDHHDALYNASNYVAPPVVNVGPRPNLSCNEIESSPVNCFSATPQSPIPLTYA